MKIAFLFSGQGAQYSGMLRDLNDNETAAKQIFDYADRVLERKISNLCFQGTQEELNLTHNTQPCVLTCDLAAAMVLRSYGVEADVVAGFSLGEYAALAYAGVLSMEDALRIIQIRADAMQDAVPIGTGSMAAVRSSDVEKIEEICSLINSYVIPANYNSPSQTVISGTIDGIDEAMAKLEENGVRAMKLAVSAPFHCMLMEPAAKRLEQEFTKIDFRNASIPVYMNVDGAKYIESTAFPALLVQQAMSPVQWRRTIENMYQEGVNTFIECGPGKTLSGLVKKTLKDVSVYRVEDIKTLNETLASLGKA